MDFELLDVSFGNEGKNLIQSNAIRGVKGAFILFDNLTGFPLDNISFLSSLN